MSCAIRESSLGRHMRAITLENDQLAATVLVDKGADIYRLEHRRTAVDVLWKTPWGVREPNSGIAPAPSSEVAWLEHYAGGWQVLFPNGGNACTYKGVELPFHGEASAIPWEITALVATTEEARVGLTARLHRSPFRIERTLSLRHGEAMLTLEETITNEGAETLAAMWSHHPAFGAPFLSPAVRIDTGARQVWAEATYDTSNGRVEPGGRWRWPYAASRAGAAVDLRRVPEEPGDMLAYLGDFSEGWYAITNPDLGFGLAQVWPASIFPYAWYWQELHSSSGYPWYRSCYTMAIEPASTIPGLGLTRAMEETGSHLVLAAGEQRSITLRTVFYDAEAGMGVAHVAADGTVQLASAHDLD